MADMKGEIFYTWYPWYPCLAGREVRIMSTYPFPLIIFPQNNPKLTTQFYSSNTTCTKRCCPTAILSQQVAPTRATSTYAPFE
jgi:hypothetical protein